MTEEEAREKRREYMREYMREYRSDPDNKKKQYLSGRRRLERLKGNDIPFETVGRPPKSLER